MPQLFLSEVLRMETPGQDALVLGSTSRAAHAWKRTVGVSRRWRELANAVTPWAQLRQLDTEADRYEYTTILKEDERLSTYVPLWLLAWGANMNIQYCTAASFLSYIAKYVPKPETSGMVADNEALRARDNRSARMVRYLNARKVGAPEVVYDIFQYKMKEGQTIVHLTTQPPEQRRRCLHRRQAALAAFEPDGGDEDDGDWDTASVASFNVLPDPKNEGQWLGWYEAAGGDQVEDGLWTLGCDAGCGAGKWLPFLGSLVDDLLAIDCSQKLVERAKRVYGSPGRVTATGRPRAPCRFGVVDLTKDEPGEVERHDLVVSANVLIAPDRAVCEAILAATLKRVAAGGFLVLLVPSHESARAVANVYMRHRLPQKKKLGRSDRHRDFTPLNAPEVEAQVWKRWGVRTQTYSLAALRGMLNVHEGYDVERIQRVEYDWDTELDIKPPKAVARPFDWLAVVRRRD